VCAGDDARLLSLRVERRRHAWGLEAVGAEAAEPDLDRGRLADPVASLWGLGDVQHARLPREPHVAIHGAQTRAAVEARGRGEAKRLAQLPPLERPGVEVVVAVAEDVPGEPDPAAALRRYCRLVARDAGGRQTHRPPDLVPIKRRSIHLPHVVAIALPGHPQSLAERRSGGPHLHSVLVGDPDDRTRPSVGNAAGVDVPVAIGLARRQQPRAGAACHKARLQPVLDARRLHIPTPPDARLAARRRIEHADAEPLGAVLQRQP